MTTTIAQTQPATAAVEPAAIDPVQARAAFFADLELLELTMVIPQADAPTEPINKY
ncbi:MAG: hypothetical protein ACK46X_02400 [Candidatus Sericytochromatia bacterium]